MIELKLSRQSHQKIEVDCDYRISDKCIKRKNIQYRDYMDIKDNNNGKYICLYCSRQLKHSGRINPNCKYKDLDDNFFKQIDTEQKAYLLGWIISDGHINKGGFCIKIHNKDIICLMKLRDIICESVPIKTEQRNMVSLTISSQQISKDLCKLLQINPGKKCDIVTMPELENIELQLACIRGIFDGDGSLINPLTNKKNHLRSKITTSSINLQNQIIKYINIPLHQHSDTIEWACNNALDMLGKIYNNATIYLDRKYKLYKMWCSYTPGMGGNNFNHIESIKCIRTRKDAILPYKNRVSDTGYDLTAIDILKQENDVTYYTTGIKIQMPFGWAADVRPRSSISKTGYILANSIGTIDRTYLGEIIIALRKVNKDMPDLELPYRIAQLVPIQVNHLNIEEVNTLEETERGEAGFGSSGI